MLRASGLTMTYPGGSNALTGLTVDVPAGSVGLVGGNGAGKTTLFRLMLGLMHPTSGVLEVAGRRVDDHPGRLVDHHHVGILIDDVERDGLRDHVGRLGDGASDGDDIARVNDRAWPRVAPVEPDMRVLDQLVRVAAREVGYIIGHVAVQAEPILVGLYHQS